MTICAAGCKDKGEFRAKHGPDLFMTDIDEYDRICKVEIPAMLLTYVLS